MCTGLSGGRWATAMRAGAGAVGTTLVVVAMLWLTGAARLTAAAPDVRGAWRAQSYALATGQHYDVDGLIVFTDSDWSVLFFVVPEGGEPERGSAEGGTYTLDDDRLVFTHLFHMSVGSELPGLAASELRMVARKDASDAPKEPSRVERTGDQLAIQFPSGNRMTFRLSSTTD